MRRRIVERPVETRVARRPAAVGRRLVERREIFERPKVFERSEAFAMDERSRRIRAAEDAGFLVVRSRTIEFPDGRRVRTYSPYEEPDDLDD